MNGISKGQMTFPFGRGVGEKEYHFIKRLPRLRPLFPVIGIVLT
jgi:hypothetical protein